jgi:hypothetical protein
MEALWRGAINTFRNANVNRRNLNFTVFKAKNNAIRLAQDCKIARGSSHEPGIHKYSDDASGDACKLPAGL